MSGPAEAPNSQEPLPVVEVTKPTHRIFKPPQRLGIRALDGRGVTAAQAIARADKNVADLKDEMIAAIDSTIMEMRNRFGPTARRDGAEYEALYTLSIGIIDLSNYLPGTGIDRAASSLCDLVDRCWSAGQWDWPSVDVHLEALRMLRMGKGVNEEMRAAILQGLSKVSRRVVAKA